MKRILLCTLIFAVTFGITNWATAGRNRDYLSQSAEGLYLQDFEFSGVDVATLSNESTGTSNTKTFTTDPIIIYDVIYATTTTGAGTIKTDIEFKFNVQDSSATANTYFVLLGTAAVATGINQYKSIYYANNPVRLPAGLKYNFSGLGAQTTTYLYLYYRKM